MKDVDKIALVDAALAGKEPERIPFSVWYHFPPEARGGSACARAHIEHYRRYDVDYLKVMNDNPYDMPESMPVIELPKQWLELEPLSGNEPGFAAELEALREIDEEIGSEVRFIVTVFGPWSTAMKLSDKNAVRHLREDPESFEAGVAAVTESLSNFAQKAVKAGASGIFLAASGAEPSMLTREEYRRFIKPYDIQLLEAVSDAPFNLLHVHGTDVYMDLFLDYPATAFNWPSHRSDFPVSKMRELTDKCLVCGIDERGPIAEGKMRKSIIQVSEALSDAGRDGFMVGTECTISPDTSPDLICALRDLVSQL